MKREKTTYTPLMANLISVVHEPLLAGSVKIERNNGAGGASFSAIETVGDYWDDLLNNSGS